MNKTDNENINSIIKLLKTAEKSKPLDIEFDEKDTILNNLVSAINNLIAEKEENKNNDEKEKLVKTIQVWETAFNSTSEMISIQDKEYNIIRCNKAYLDFLGIDYAQSIGKKCFQLLHKKDKPLKSCACHWVINQKKHMFYQYYEPSLKSYLQVSYSPCYTEKGEFNGLVHIIRDVTEQKKLEDELHKAQKMESVSLLAGGIAHDFNNFLQGITANIQYIMKYIKLDEETQDCLNDAQSACNQAKSLTSQFLTFSKGHIPIKRTNSIKEFIIESAEFLLKGSNVKCEFFIEKNLWFANVDMGQINQVINNIIMNSKQAMIKGGIIKVYAQNIVINAKNKLLLKKGKYIELKIEDTGVGIPKEYLEKIFDPYFTTKVSGSGLGLPICYSIISKHGGTIIVDSVVGKSTAFTIYLPAKNKKNNKLSSKKKAQSHTGKYKLLFMDDEELIRTFANRVFSRIGYNVTLVENGEEAVEVFKQSFNEGNLFDIVMLDLTIPGQMGGKETIIQLRKIDPDVKAIVISANLSNSVLANYEKYGFADCLLKPFDLEDVDRVLNKILK